MIPAILHQTWKSKEDLPERFAFWRASFGALNPGLDLRLYDDRDNRALLERVFPQLLPLYDSFPREIFRVDFIRPVYLFSEGGYYADLDFQCLQPLDRLKPAGKRLLLGKMGTDETYRQSIPNAFMASAPGEGFWIGYLARIARAWAASRTIPGIEERPEYAVGPVVLKETVLDYLRDRTAFAQRARGFIESRKLDVDPTGLSFGEMGLYPGHILYPISWKDVIHRRFLRDMRKEGKLYGVEEAKELFPRSVAVTYWTASWKGPAESG